MEAERSSELQWPRSLCSAKQPYQCPGGPAVQAEFRSSVCVHWTEVGLEGPQPRGEGRKWALQPPQECVPRVVAKS